MLSSMQPMPASGQRGEITRDAARHPDPPGTCTHAVVQVAAPLSGPAPPPPTLRPRSPEAPPAQPETRTADLPDPPAHPCNPVAIHTRSPSHDLDNPGRAVRNSSVG